ncbi:MAG: 4Fe-4S binding protein [Lachnospiraceae bacterium]
MANHLKFERDRCKGCELCVSVCPKHILELDSVVNAKGYCSVTCIDGAACIGCASCAKICPDSVISVYRD